MNPYLKNLNKIEFVVTNACTGKCKHCSEGDHARTGEHIDPALAAEAVRKISGKYHIQTVMAFGGEPLLYPEAVYAIMNAAKERHIPKRQVITNGFFSKSPSRMREVAKRLADAGVNDLLLSVDAFHEEAIPLETVKAFAAEAVSFGIPTRLQPAWLKSREDENVYNLQTRRLLDSFKDLNIPTGEGNIIFPEGNAKKYLAAFFEDFAPENPYEEDPSDVRCVSFSQNGDVLGANAYQTDVIEILEKYTP